MIDSGGTGNSSQLRRRHCFSPWNMPASTRILRPLTVSRYFDPVTVPAAPKKVSVVVIHPLLQVGGQTAAKWQDGRMTDLSKYGPWAVIAGGSEGVGAEFATQLAEAGVILRA